MTYGRARLWLGISGVGTFVVLTTIGLAVGVPAQLASLFDSSVTGQTLTLLAFVAAYVVVQLPFDVCGGYLLPRRFGRAHLDLGSFIARLLRGVSVHALLLTTIAAGLLFSAQLAGAIGVIVSGAVVSVLLLGVRLPLASVIASLRSHPVANDESAAGDSALRAQSRQSDDEGFTGGFTGVIAPSSTILPARWLNELDQQTLSIIARRRRLAVRTGAWLRGRILAILFTWVGIVLAAVLVGSERLGTAEGIITFSLMFTLWSFLGLLTLPTPSRAGVVEVDAALRASGVDAAALSQTVSRLDQYQDREAQRPSGIEAIFHPVPAANNRIDGPQAAGRLGFLDAARTSVFLSAAGLGLLGRAVHCNCGRPALWVYLPSD